MSMTAIEQIIDSLEKSDKESISKESLLVILKEAKSLDLVHRQLAYIKGQQDRVNDIFNLEQFDPQ